MSTSTISDTDKIIQQLEVTKTEVEQFIHELELENTDPEVRYQQLKEELGDNIKEIRKLFDKGILTEAWASTLSTKLIEIETHLQNPGKNTVDHIKLFLRAIKGAIKEVADRVHQIPFSDMAEKIHHQLQRQSLKFEILKLRLVVGKLKLTYAGEEIKHQMNQKINTLLHFISNSKYETEEKIIKVRLTVRRIYADLNKLFSR